MNTEEIIGKTFTAFKFEKQSILNYSSRHKNSEGLLATVLNINPAYPEYTKVRIKMKDETTTEIHYPTEMIKAQIEMNEKEIDLDLLFKEIDKKTNFVLKK